MSAKKSSTGHVIAIAALVIGLPGSLLAFSQLTNEADSNTSTAQSADDAVVNPGGDADTGNSGNTGGASAADTPPEPVPTVADDDGGADPAPVGLSGCEIEVDHIGAEIRSDPSHSALSLGSVPSGVYVPLDTTIAPFAGLQERWYLLDVGGTTGWLAVNPIIVKSQSAGCP